MDIKNIEKLANIMQDKGLTRISVKENETEILLEREISAAARFIENINDAAAVGIIGGATAPTKIELEPIAAENPANEGNAVISPTVGVFYAASSPDSDPFVQVGTKVKKGDVLCIVEAMKLMNEITSEFDGMVTEICVGNGQVVEFGQPLFRITE